MASSSGSGGAVSLSARMQKRGRNRSCAGGRVVLVHCARLRPDHRDARIQGKEQCPALAGVLVLRLGSVGGNETRPANLAETLRLSETRLAKGGRAVECVGVVGSVRDVPTKRAIAVRSARRPVAAGSTPAAAGRAAGRERTECARLATLRLFIEAGAEPFVRSSVAWLPQSLGVATSRRCRAGKRRRQRWRPLFLERWAIDEPGPSGAAWRRHSEVPVFQRSADERLSLLYLGHSASHPRREGRVCVCTPRSSRRCRTSGSRSTRPSCRSSVGGSCGRAGACPPARP